MSLSCYRCGPFVFHPAQRRLVSGGREIVLQARALDVLHVLVVHQGALVLKRELLDAVWPGTVVEENNLQVHISQLRKTLGHDSIKTVPGRGYQLTPALRPRGGCRAGSAFAVAGAAVRPG